MSNIDKQALREAAEKATKGEWAVEFDGEVYSTDGVNHEQIAMVFSENEARDAAFIAAANPATVLALLNELEAKDKQIDNLKATAAHSNAGWKEAHEQEARAEAAEKRIAELEEEVKSALARVDIKCAQLCRQDEIIEGLKLEVREFKPTAGTAKGE